MWAKRNRLEYLLDNPLLTDPLHVDHIKPRLLGHWGTTPGLNFIHAHANRVIKARDIDAIEVIGPGHGGPAAVAAAWMEGSYTELYPSVTRDEVGMRRLFHQFSFPGGIGSHVTPETPGSIHEGETSENKWRSRSLADMPARPPYSQTIMLRMNSAILAAAQAWGGGQFADGVLVDHGTTRFSKPSWVGPLWSRT